MKIAESLIRIALLLILSSVGVLLIFCEERDENIWSFVLHVIMDKAIGVGCIYSMIKLYDRWSKTDRWIARFEAWNTKGLEKE